MADNIPRQSPHISSSSYASNRHQPSDSRRAVLLARRRQSVGQQFVPQPFVVQQKVDQQEGWTGFSGKKLWDWLQLLIVPFLLAMVGIAFTVQQNYTSLQVSKDQQQEVTLKAYLDDMSTLLFQYKLSESNEGDAVRQIANAKTLTTLSQLDGKRKGEVCRFLFGANLIYYPSVVDLTGADLSSADLSGTYLDGADLGGANLRQANLSHTQLYNAHLFKVDLSGADLSYADLLGADDLWSHIGSPNEDADLTGANLTDTNLTNARVNVSVLKKQAFSLQGATMPDGSISN